jgi:membrane associated rhomboid family serine protease
MNEERFDHRSRYRLPLATIVLVGIMAYAFGMERRALEWGIINEILTDFHFSWAEFRAAPWANVPRLLSHTFLHANESHIIGNVVFFAIFAPAVERAMGHLWFAFLYMVWGVAAAVAQGFFEPFALGMIGASGAISGAAGAYFVLFPLKMPPSFLNRLLGRWLTHVPAFFWIGLWFVAQLEGGFRAVLPDLAPGEMAQVAYWAHIGGFAAGSLSAAPFVWFRGLPK